MDIQEHPPVLKERIISVLNARNLSYKQLVDYLGTTEAELDQALADNTIEIRTLELISKELRIPLYSFFRDHEHPAGEEIPYYNVNIWAPAQMQLQQQNEHLVAELERMKLEIAKKELLIQALEEQLKKEGQ
jgi:transcriptional regulator with XRE-family HTH domain